MADSPTICAIATAYQLTRQALHRLRRKHNLTARELTDPEVVFRRLLETGRRGKLRARLANPAARQGIAEEINLAAIRGPVPEVQSKIQSLE